MSSEFRLQHVKGLAQQRNRVLFFVRKGNQRKAVKRGRINITGVMASKLPQVVRVLAEALTRRHIGGFTKERFDGSNVSALSWRARTGPSGLEFDACLLHVGFVGSTHERKGQSHGLAPMADGAAGISSRGTLERARRFAPLKIV